MKLLTLIADDSWKPIGVNMVAGFLFVPFLDDKFFQFLAVAIPAVIGITVSVLTGYARVRNLLVDELTKSVMKEVKKVLDGDREKVVEQIGDELWARLGVLSKIKKQMSDAEQHEDAGEKGFDLKELAKR